MRKNVGTIDATIRITMGLLGLAYGIGKMSQRRGRTPWFLMAMSAMKVAEGTTRYCPMLGAFGLNTRKGMGAQFLNRAADKMMSDVIKDEESTLEKQATQVPKTFDEDFITQAFVQELNKAESQKSESHDERVHPSYM